MRNGFQTIFRPEEIEKQDFSSIAELNNKCERDLYRLRAILPEPPEDATRYQALRTHYVRKMREDTVRDIISGIKLCNTVSISLRDQSGNRADEEESQALQVELQTLTMFVAPVTLFRLEGTVLTFP